MIKNFEYTERLLRACKIFPFKEFQLNRQCNLKVGNKLKYSIKSPSSVNYQIKSECNSLSAFGKKKIYETNSPKWKNVTSLLLKHGFNEVECFKMIKHCPVLLQVPLADTEKGLDMWASCRINFDVFREVLVNQPSLITVVSSDIQQRVLYYQGLCKSPKTLISFFIQCPNVVMDDFKSILKKIEYLLKDKRVKKKELFESKALIKSLDFMSLRITLLENCGIYRVIVTHPHAIQKAHNHKNPTLGSILDTDDETFSKKVAGITLEEYITYSELFQSNKLDIANDGILNDYCYDHNNNDDDDDDDDDDDESFQ